MTVQLKKWEQSSCRGQNWAHRDEFFSCKPSILLHLLHRLSLQVSALFWILLKSHLLPEVCPGAAQMQWSTPPLCSLYTWKPCREHIGFLTRLLWAPALTSHLYSQGPVGSMNKCSVIRDCSQLSTCIVESYFNVWNLQLSNAEWSLDQQLSSVD